MDKTVQYVGFRPWLEYVARSYGYSKTDDTAELIHCISCHFIDAHWRPFYNRWKWEAPLEVNWGTWMVPAHNERDHSHQYLTIYRFTLTNINSTGSFCRNVCKLFIEPIENKAQIRKGLYNPWEKCAMMFLSKLKCRHVVSIVQNADQVSGMMSSLQSKKARHRIVLCCPSGDQLMKRQRVTPGTPMQSLALLVWFGDTFEATTRDCYNLG